MNMQQNYFLTSKILTGGRMLSKTGRKFLAPTLVEQTSRAPQIAEPINSTKEEKAEAKNQKLYCISEGDELPKTRLLGSKSNPVSINVTPRTFKLRSIALSPHGSTESSKSVPVYDLKPANASRDNQNGTLSQFEIISQRFTKLQQTSNLPNPEPVKYSEKSYGVIKGFGICTNQGLMRSYNEDRVSIVLNLGKPGASDQKGASCSVFGLFDGHGGSKCADFLRNNLHNNIVKSKYFPGNVQEALREAFEDTEKAFIEEALAKPAGSHERSGSCALVMVLFEDTCYVCNLGDSRAIMSQNSGTSTCALTRDHKPSDRLEQKRIIDAGGKIYQNASSQAAQSLGQELDINPQEIEIPWRILPGRLSVSRAFGDIEAKLPQFGGNADVLISKPEITKFKISQAHDFIVLGCDGIFDRLSNEEVVSSIWDNINKGKASSLHEMMGNAAESTIKAAMLNKSLDNVTAIVVCFTSMESNFNNIKTQIHRAPSKLGVSMLSQMQENSKRPTSKSVSVYSFNNVVKSQSQRNESNESENQNVIKKDAKNPDSKGNINLERKSSNPAEYSSKGYLPNISSPKQSSILQSNRK